MSWHAVRNQAQIPRVVINHRATLNLVARMWQVKVTRGRLCISACRLHVVWGYHLVLTPLPLGQVTFPEFILHFCQDKLSPRGCWFKSWLQRQLPTLIITHHSSPITILDPYTYYTSLHTSSSSSSPTKTTYIIHILYIPYVRSHLNQTILSL
jgi:hypothetical protein